MEKRVSSSMILVLEERVVELDEEYVVEEELQDDEIWV